MQIKTIAVHSIKKHRELQELGIELLRKEKKYKGKYHVFIYVKTKKVVEVLNANNNKSL